MKLRAMIIVLIEPTKKRKAFVSCSVSSDAKTAAWPAPRPGRNEAKGAVREAAKDDFRICLIESLIFFIGVRICFGRIVLDFRETNKVERPKRPVRRGRRGCSMGSLKVIVPRKPARMKMVSAGRNSSSLNIR